jgi:hypothetical protein
VGKQAGAKPVTVDERGRTPLMDALLHGNDAAAMELVERGADVNAVDFEVGVDQDRVGTLEKETIIIIISSFYRMRCPAVVRRSFSAACYSCRPSVLPACCGLA